VSSETSKRGILESGILSINGNGITDTENMVYKRTTSKSVGGDVEVDKVDALVVIQELSK